MEQLFKELEVKKSTTPKSYAELIEKAGLRKMPIGYSIITPKSIYDLLVKRIKDKCKSDGVEIQYIRDRLYQSNNYPNNYCVDWRIPYEYEDIKKFLFIHKKVVIRTYREFEYYWIEMDVEGYMGTPPTYILEKIIAEKKKFDEIKIVVLKHKEVLPDPLLIGRNKNDENRYLIDWWDTDIDPSEIEMK